MTQVLSMNYSTPVIAVAVAGWHGGHSDVKGFGQCDNNSWTRCRSGVAGQQQNFPPYERPPLSLWVFFGRWVLYINLNDNLNLPITSSSIKPFFSLIVQTYKRDICLCHYWWRFMGSENQSGTHCHRHDSGENVSRKSLAQKRLRPTITE
jgi:hypothetical protein